MGLRQRYELHWSSSRMTSSSISRSCLTRILGGVVIICSKRLVKSEPHVQVFDIIPGRLHAICISHMVHDVCLTIVNVHNHELSLADLSRFEVWFAPRVRASQDDPTRKQVWPTGDMNFAAAGDLPRRVDCTGQTVDLAPIDMQQHMTKDRG